MAYPTPDKPMFPSVDRDGRFVAAGVRDGIRTEASVATRADAEAAAQSAAEAKAETGVVIPRMEAIETMAGLAPGEVVDGQTANLIIQPGTLTQTALNAQSAEVVKDTAIQRTLESFGMVGDGATNDASGLSSALTWATGAPGRRLVGTSGKTYRVASLVTIPAGSLVVDFQDSTLALSNGAMAKGTVPTPFLSTTSTAGVTRKATKFTVASATGVRKGDLVSVRSAVEWSAGIPLHQHYVVQDVDTTTGDVWVEGRIVGDITPAQITAAGKTGGVTVEFYRLSEYVHMSNVTVVSPNRDAADTLVMLYGYARGRLDNITVDKPNRMGFYINLCGHITVNNPAMSQFGYVTKDEGYSNLSHHPGGLGYGYGFVVANTATVVFRDADIQSGWHGIDVARGTSNALIIGAVAHKNAFAFSTHEGAWVFEIRSSRVFGGMAITNRAAELIVDGCRIETSLGRAIIGQNHHQYLSIANTTFDLSNGSQPFAFNAGDAGYPAATRSAEKPYAELVNVTITGLSGSSSLVIPGDLVIDGLRIKADTTTVATTDFRIFTKGSGAAIIRAMDVAGIGSQNAMQLDGFASVDFIAFRAVGPVGTPSNSTVSTITGAVPTKVTLKGGLVDGPSYIFRSDTTPVTYDIEDTTLRTGRMILGGADSRLRNAINNRTPSATLTSGAMTTTNAVGNVVLNLT